MDSTRVSEALNPGSIPGEATKKRFNGLIRFSGLIVTPLLVIEQ